jgi:hypothetical protein
MSLLWIRFNILFSTVTIRYWVFKNKILKWNATSFHYANIFWKPIRQKWRKPHLISFLFRFHLCMKLLKKKKSLSFNLINSFKKSDSSLFCYSFYLSMPFISQTLVTIWSDWKEKKHLRNGQYMYISLFQTPKQMKEIPRKVDIQDK